MNVPFSPPDITNLEIKEVVDTLKSGWLTTGPKTKLFEQQIAAYCHTKQAVCLNSATAALELTLHVLGVGPGDEVITSVYTYTASASVICHVGATPVLIDTAPDSYEMDYDALERAITPKTKVIIPVDVGGVLCDYERIFEIVRRCSGKFTPRGALQALYGRVVVLADAAHSFGATQGGRQSGELADFTCFSFHAVKNLTTGEGGAVTWREHNGVNSKQLYQEYQLLSLHGQSKDALAKSKAGAWEYDIISPAYKCNMTDIMSSLGLAQLRRYSGLLQRRRELIERYDRAFSDCNVQILQHFGDRFCSSGHLYLVRMLGKDEAYRNEVIIKLAEAGIATNVHYKPLPMHTAYQRLGFRIAEYPNAYAMYCNEITLPLFSAMTDPQQEHVIHAFRTILREGMRTHAAKKLGQAARTDEKRPGAPLL
ncbi:DegT/DnrJ/EryC1/StrS family aminotransferase [Hydrogenoanaerobacterium sp.]|uniref:DegT/DnrJ/EryC1/StrS family aminotransferase n=1 Tax=Hydrogenoanaerobacterium sp. TaxID=2953763 RepID=UPI00289BEF12|nr:DegT/DnrJ/EryC1/StrS family aminotransferase [Hydrogenoanaerobacterium sp.]